MVPEALSSRRIASTSWPEELSRFPVGSSASSSDGPPATALATATRWHSPPDSSCGRWASPVPETDAPERVGGPFPPLPARGAAVQHPVGDVVERADPGGQVERWKTKPMCRGAQRGQLPVGECSRVVPGDADGSGRGTVESADQVEHGRLSRPRGADDGDELARVHPQVHPPQGAYPPG
ncbi:hypothetical protein GCM10018952_52010 [Streptosporangium vulgare]